MNQSTAWINDEAQEDIAKRKVGGSVGEKQISVSSNRNRVEEFGLSRRLKLIYD